MLALSDVTQALVDIVNTQAQRNALGLEAVEFGDVSLVPRTPTVCFVPQHVEHNPQSSAFLAEDLAVVHIIVYHGPLSNERLNVKAGLQLAEAISLEVLTDKTLGGLIVTSWIGSVELGVGASGDDLLLATRMVWNGKARTQY